MRHSDSTSLRAPRGARMCGARACVSTKSVSEQAPGRRQQAHEHALEHVTALCPTVVSVPQHAWRQRRMHTPVLSRSAAQPVLGDLCAACIAAAREEASRPSGTGLVCGRLVRQARQDGIHASSTRGSSGGRSDGSHVDGRQRAGAWGRGDFALYQLSVMGGSDAPEAQRAEGHWQLGRAWRSRHGAGQRRAAVSAPSLVTCPHAHLLPRRAPRSLEHWW